MGLGEKVFNTLTDWAKAVIEKFIETASPTVVKEIRTRFAKELFNPDLFATPEIKKAIEDLQTAWSASPENIGDIAEGLMDVVIGKGTQLQLEGITGISIDDNTPISQGMFGQIAIITDITLVASLLSLGGQIMSFGLLDDLGKQVREYLNYSGLSQTTQFGYGMILSSALSPLVIREINSKTLPTTYDEATGIRLAFRQIIDDAEFNDVMGKLGYNPDRASKLFTGSWFYPQPTDFIRFAVREVFKSDVVEKFGYDEAFPIDETIPNEQLPQWIRDVVGESDITLADAVRYATLDPEVLRWYWRAHWELPSPTMGYEMLHRGVIDEDELTDLLRIADFAPFWIPKMIAISYVPYTRVDARRMYEEGILDDDAYLTSLKDLGYDDERANNMLEWTRLRKLTPEKDLTKSMIERAYRESLKDRPWTLTALQGLGYDPEESELIVALIDAQNESDKMDEDIEHLIRLFIRDLMDEKAFVDALDKLGLSEAHKSRVQEKALRERQKRLKTPSKVDLEGWLKKGIITPDQFRVKMRTLGYLNDDIALYIKELQGG